MVYLKHFSFFAHWSHANQTIEDCLHIAPLLHLVCLTLRFTTAVQTPHPSRPVTTKTKPTQFLPTTHWCFGNNMQAFAVEKELANGSITSWLPFVKLFCTSLFYKTILSPVALHDFGQDLSCLLPNLLLCWELQAMIHFVLLPQIDCRHFPMCLVAQMNKISLPTRHSLLKVDGILTNIHVSHCLAARIQSYVPTACEQ